MEAWWLAFVNEEEAEKPAPNSDCPPTYGNSDIYAAAVADPSP
jgi:hypothetical protein